MRARIYEAKLSGASHRSARDRILTRLTRDVLESGVDNLCIESCDQDKQDRACIRAAIRDHCRPVDRYLSYHHRSGVEEPLLWAADVFVWAWGQGGRFRDMLDPVDLTVVTIDMP